MTFQERRYFYLMLLTYLVWPFAAFIVAIWNYKLSASKYIIILFLGFYGMTFIYSNEAMDSFRYVENFVHTGSLSWNEFSLAGQKDFFIPLFNFALSRITENPAFLYFSYAILFAFFYMNSIWIFVEQYKVKKSINCLIFVIGLLIIVPIYYINGIRFWTATWICFLAIYKILVEGKKKYLFLSLFSALVHIGYIFPFIALLVYQVIGRKDSLLWIVAIVTFLVPNLINVQELLLKNVGLVAGSQLEESTLRYASEAYMNARAAAEARAKWFVIWKGNLLFIYTGIALIINRSKKVKAILDKGDKELFSFILLFISFINVTAVIPSFGDRFRILWYLLSFAYLFKVYYKKNKELKLIPALAIFPLLLYAAVDFRIYSFNLNAFIFASNPIVAVLLNPEYPVYEIFFD